MLGEGMLFVSDPGNERLQVFQLDGTLVHTISMPEAMLGDLVVVDGQIIVNTADQIETFALDGTFLSSWPIEDDGLSFGLGVLPSGRLVLLRRGELLTMRLDGTITDMGHASAAIAFATHGPHLFLLTFSRLSILPLAKICQ
jgi:hypothetical protein